MAGPTPDQGIDPSAGSAPLTPPPDTVAPTGAAQQPSAQAEKAKIGGPALYNLIRGLITPPTQSPAPGQMARPMGRLDVFENFLTSFLSSMGAGMQAAHGPGAFSKGFGAGVVAPMQMQQQLGLTQAEIQQKQAQAQQSQAQTGLIRAQAQPVQVPLGNGESVTALQGAIPTIYRGLPAAQASAQSKVQAAQTSGQYKLAGEQLKLMAATGQLSRLIPDVDENGQRFYHALNKYGQEISRIDANAIPAFMQRTSDTVSFQTDADGNIVALPKRTVSSPVIPGGGTAPPSQGGKPSGFPRQTASGGGPRVITQGKIPQLMLGSMPDGSQVAGTPSELKQSGAQNITQLPENLRGQTVIARQMTSPGGLFDLVSKDLAKFKPGELSPLNSRLDEFMAGTWGSGDPRYVALRTHLNGLLSTALLQAHVGARGGQNMMEHFSDIAKAGKMDANTLQAAVDAEKQYVNEKAMRPPSGQSGKVRVQIPGMAPGMIDAKQLDAFRKKYPAARVMQ